MGEARKKGEHIWVRMYMTNLLQQLCNKLLAWSVRMSSYRDFVSLNNVFGGREKIYLLILIFHCQGQLTTHLHLSPVENQE
jgi:hypothetical protein